MKIPKISKINIDTIPFDQCPAKTRTHSQDRVSLGRSVFNHCQIVGYVALGLLNLLPQYLRKALFPEGCELVCACHDIGKVCPTFVLKLYLSARIQWEQNYPFLKQFVTEKESLWGGHAAVSALTMAKENHSQAIQIIVGQHHGFLPETGTRTAHAAQFGGPAWQAERKKLLDALQEEFIVPWPTISTDTQIRAISGLTSVADWIGSGSLFNNPEDEWQPLIPLALKSAGYTPFSLKKQRRFEDIFNFSPYDAQHTLITCCHQPGVYILEAPMGLGKTEAALYAAYQRLQSTDTPATGIYFALPTQLTSNKIYDRFNHFLTAILAENCPHRKALLLHGNAWLQQTEIGEEGRPGNSWFDSKKRGLLAPFAVGTLDQALMAVMNVRHSFVRAFGLAGKVVIIDEVHSYDAYTGIILDALIEGLRALQCTVIILSATLDQERRQSLLAAPVISQAYPLITAIDHNKPGDIQEIAVSLPTTHTVDIHFIEEDDQAVEEAVQRAAQGQQVLWIENTVNEAQQRYLTLAARCQETGASCGLLHSRFTPADRQNNENRWVNILGKEGWKERGQQGRIVVGTQVLEQSLDIDADFLLTRFAPTDMLLQRIGRLWRHKDTPRSTKAVCEAWLLAPNYDEAIQRPNESFGATAWVYSTYILCRSLEAWQNHCRKTAVIQLPDHIRSLIHATYHARNEQGRMAAMHHELLHGSPAKKGLKQLRQIARSTLSPADQTRPDTETQTRYSEEDSSEILILKAIKTDSDNKKTHLTLLSGDIISVSWRKHPHANSAEHRRHSAALMRQMVPCRFSKLPKRLSYSRAKALGLDQLLYIGHPEYSTETPFAIALLSHANGQLEGFEQPLSERYIYTYRNHLGLQITTNKEST